MFFPSSSEKKCPSVKKYIGICESSYYKFMQNMINFLNCIIDRVSSFDNLYFTFRIWFMVPIDSGLFSVKYNPFNLKDIDMQFFAMNLLQEKEFFYYWSVKENYKKNYKMCMFLKSNCSTIPLTWTYFTHFAVCILHIFNG